MEDNSLFDALTERQRTFLRLVREPCSTHEIAFRTGDSPSAIDKQLTLACRKLGVHSRHQAARLFHDYERRVESLDPRGTIFSSSRRRFWPLPWPLPSKATPINMMTRQQVMTWAMILAIATPAGITVAAMLVIAIALLLGVHL